MNDWFKLRDCPRAVPVVFADQPELFPHDRGATCLRWDIDTCLGPCAGLCSRTGYTASVRSAKAFLDGRDKAVLKELTKRMTAAAAELKFEQATAARDRLQTLTWLDDRLTFLRTARKGGSFVYPLTGPDGRDVWYLIHRGEVWAAVRPPATDADRTEVAAVLARVFASGPAEAGLTSQTIDSVLLVTAWFRKYRDEKPRLLTRDQAIRRCAERPQPAG